MPSLHVAVALWEKRCNFIFKVSVFLGKQPWWARRCNRAFSCFSSAVKSSRSPMEQSTSAMHKNDRQSDVVKIRNCWAKNVWVICFLNIVNTWCYLQIAKVPLSFEAKVGFGTTWRRLYNDEWAGKKTLVFPFPINTFLTLALHITG